MNLVDFAVITIIIIFGLIGMTKGFIHSVFKLVSFFVAVVVSVKCYPLVANLLEKTAIFTNIKSSIHKNLMLQQQAHSPEIGEGAKLTAQSVIDSLNLPGFLKEMIENSMIDKITDLTKMIDIAKVMESISDILAHVVLDIISLVLLYILIRIALVFLRFVLQGIAKLPVFKQMDKMGGFAFGALEGLLTVYIIFTVLMLYHSLPTFKVFFDAIEGTANETIIYRKKYKVDWMFPKNTII